MINRLQDFIRKEKMLQSGDRVLLAISGGLDSVVLSRLLILAGYQVEFAHCNFRLRGEESERDEAFVTSLAASWQIPVHVKQFDTAAYAADHKLSIQVAARELRYQWLETLRKERGMTAMATAHHMQDNVETVWMNLSRGTGLAGMHGILPVQGPLIRPLLFATREEIAAFAARENLTYVEDSSNTTDKYTRNYFRHHVLPAVLNSYPDAINQTGASINRFREAEILYQQAVDRHRKKLLVQKGEEYFIPVAALKNTIPLATLTFELLKPFDFSAPQSQQVIDLLDAEPGKYVTTGKYRVVRDRKWLVITPVDTSASAHFIIEKGQAIQLIPGHQLRLHYLPNDAHSISADPAIACINAAEIKFPLLLRKWKQGDYFYPLGMTKKKKLSRFFIDQKLSLPQKEKVWVLESDKRIVWIAGLRIDNRFRVTDQTTEVLKITMTEL